MNELDELRRRMRRELLDGLWLGMALGTAVVYPLLGVGLFATGHLLAGVFFVACGLTAVFWLFLRRG